MPRPEDKGVRQLVARLRTTAEHAGTPAAFFGSNALWLPGREDDLRHGGVWRIVTYSRMCQVQNHHVVCCSALHCSSAIVKSMHH